MLKVDNATDKHWVIGHNAMALTGRAFHDELYVFAKAAQQQIDEFLRIDPGIKRLDLRPVLVEVTVRMCTEEEERAYRLHQEQWLSKNSAAAMPGLFNGGSP